MNWAYGVTTVPERAELLKRTLASLAAGGFDSPKLFEDSIPRKGTAANWYLALTELYCTNLEAQRFAIFQDDMVCVKNLRAYLEKCQYPERGYWNLYTFPCNEKLARGKQGWFLSNQHGKGAVALVFDRRTVVDLLSSRKLVERFSDRKRGHLAIDGGVVDAMKAICVYEHCHLPSLVQHTGLQSSMSSLPQPLAPSFPGESFDAMTSFTMPNASITE